jgi:CubicO group peptidase (beta-lactamase class C family)
MIFPTRRIEAGTIAKPLPASTEIVDVDAVRFMEENHQTGLMIVRDGRVVLEAYAHGHGPEQPWVSYSVAKSAVSLLMGAALADGYIGGLDDHVTDYVPILRGGAYEGVRIRDVLRMSSGVDWNEDYGDPGSDVSREIDYGAAERLAFLNDRPRVAEAGTRFNYSTGEIFLAGAVVRGAVGNNLSEYLGQKIWGPYGMEDDASWMLVEPGGPEYAGCCISATLRDYARIGTFALDEGVTPDGARVLPEGWMAESTTPSPANPEYGYLWWLHGDGSFSARGIFGQLIHIDPSLDLVVAMHGLWPEPVHEAHAQARDRFLEQLKAGLREPAPTP